MSVVMHGRDEFAAAINTNFRLQPDGATPLELELVHVSERHETHWQENYSILFRGPLDAPLPQRIYRMEHEQMGTFDLFIVPIGMDEQGYSYEAVFNHLKK